MHIISPFERAAAYHGFQPFQYRMAQTSVYVSNDILLQLSYTWDNLTETNTSEKTGLSLQLNSAEEEFKILRKRHALGQVSLDVYIEFAEEMEKKITVISESWQNWSKTYQTRKN